MFNDSSGAKWICNSYELHLKILLFLFFPLCEIKVKHFYSLPLLCLQQECL